MFVAFFLPLLLAAETPAPFEQQKLAVDGEVLSVTPGDFDGDGLLDLLVAHLRGKTRHSDRTFSVFWNQRGRYPLRPSLSFSIADDACAFDVANIDDRKGSDIVLVGHRGVTAISFKDRENRSSSVLTKDTTLFLQADERKLPRLMLAQQVSGNGVELLVPLSDALGIYRRTAEGWLNVGRLDTDLVKIDLHRDWREIDTRHVGSFGLDVDFPDVHVVDANGDGLNDLVFSDRDHVAIFHQSPGLSFTKEPTFERDFALATDAELEEGFTSATTMVRDLDGDGVVDLLITKQVTRGITSGESTTYLFLGRPGGGYNDKAEQTIVGDGIGGTVGQLADLTGDKKPEFLLPSVSVGVLAIIRILTTQTIKVNVRVFPFEASRRFASKAAIERDLSFKVSLSGKSDLQVIDLRGDYNGDKRPDLAFGTTSGELAIYLGLGSGTLIAEDPIAKVKVNARARMLPVDLDRKGKDDVILFYPSSREERGVVMVLHNLGVL